MMNEEKHLIGLLGMHIDLDACHSTMIDDFDTSINTSTVLKLYENDMLSADKEVISSLIYEGIDSHLASRTAKVKLTDMNKYSLISLAYEEEEILIHTKIIYKTNIDASNSHLYTSAYCYKVIVDEQFIAESAELFLDFLNTNHIYTIILATNNSTNKNIIPSLGKMMNIISENEDKYTNNIYKILIDFIRNYIKEEDYTELIINIDPEHLPNFIANLMMDVYSN